jgi:hypothetical protein
MGIKFKVILHNSSHKFLYLSVMLKEQLMSTIYEMGRCNEKLSKNGGSYALISTKLSYHSDWDVVINKSIGMWRRFFKL